jgi:hypothetical protein
MKNKLKFYKHTIRFGHLFVEFEWFSNETLLTLELFTHYFDCWAIFYIQILNYSFTLGWDNLI